MRSFVDPSDVKPDGTLVVRKEAKEIVPSSFEEMKEVVWRLARKESVVLNLESLTVDLGQRMLDFASGAVYALGGTIKKIKGEKYILAPFGVNVKKVREKK